MGKREKFIPLEVFLSKLQRAVIEGEYRARKEALEQGKGFYFTVMELEISVPHRMVHEKDQILVAPGEPQRAPSTEVGFLRLKLRPAPVVEALHLPEGIYVGNRESKEIHLRTCRFVKIINPKNILLFKKLEETSE